MFGSLFLKHLILRAERAHFEPNTKRNEKKHWTRQQLTKWENLDQTITLQYAHTQNSNNNNDNNNNRYLLWSYQLGQVWPFQGLLSGQSRGYYLGQGDFCLFLWFQVFFHTQLIFCVFAQWSGNFLKIAFFKNCVPKLLFFKVPCFEFNFISIRC